MLVDQAIDQFYRSIKNHLPPSLWVALSGGMDSVVLLHALVRHKPESLCVKAIHVNHQWSSQADDWQQFCQSWCYNLGVSLQTVSINMATKTSEGWEAQARRLRYQVLANHLAHRDMLVTAHHQQDQAETVLLQLMRGCGVEGLSGMLSVTSFYPGYLARPLLHVSLQAIQAYASAHQLNWVEDPSNYDASFKRNFIRHQVLPLLQQHWPSCTQTLSATACRMQQTTALLNEVSQIDEQEVAITPYKLDLKRMTSWSRARCYQFIYHWLKHRHGFQVTNDQLTVILDEVVNAPQDAQPLFDLVNKVGKSDKWQLRRYQSSLYLVNKGLLIDSQSWTRAWLNKDEALPLPEPLGYLNLIQHKGPGLIIKPDDKLEVCFRRGGERLYLPNRQGQKSLKQLFQEWQIPPWQRDQVPLLYINSQLAAVVGYTVAAGFYTEHDGWMVEIQKG